ncbi:MAG: hypothetical protein ACFFD4_22110 [Candidatus Odinarchaeota archaeon]
MIMKITDRYVFSRETDKRGEIRKKNNITLFIVECAAIISLVSVFSLFLLL